MSWCQVLQQHTSAGTLLCNTVTWFVDTAVVDLIAYQFGVVTYMKRRKKFDFKKPLLYTPYKSLNMHAGNANVRNLLKQNISYAKNNYIR